MANSQPTTPPTVPWIGPQLSTTLRGYRLEENDAGKRPRPRSDAWRTSLAVLCVLCMSAASYLLIYHICAGIIEAGQPIVVYPED